MQSTLAAQLKRITHESTNTLNTKKLKSTHATSLLFPPAVAATQDLDTIYSIALEGFRELCLLDERFIVFERGLFSESSKDFDRFTQSKDVVKELDANLAAFLQLVSGRLLLKPAIKAVEWLVRRFRVQDQNTTALILAFLPYHAHPTLLPTLLAILQPKDLPKELVFLRPYLDPAVSVPRHVITHTLSHRRDFYNLLTSYTLSTVRSRRENHTLLSFFATVLTEALSLMCDSARTPSNKTLTEEDVVQCTLPVLEEAFRATRSPEFQIGAYMLTTVVVSKIPMKDQVLTALMARIVTNWSPATITPALACIALISQTRVRSDCEHLPEDILKALLKIGALEEKLLVMGLKYRVDNLILGLCHGILAKLGRGYGTKELKTVIGFLEGARLGPAGRKSVLTKMISTAQNLGSIKENLEEEEVRELLATRFVTWMEQGEKKRLDKAFREVLKESNVDIEMLELALRTIIRPRQIEPAPEAASDMMIAEQHPMEEVTFEKVLNSLPTSAGAVSFLSSRESDQFFSLRDAFLLAARSTKSVQKLMDAPIFSDQSSDMPLELSFLAKMWTSNPTPVIARAAALKQATAVVTKHAEDKIDYQALIPLVLVALADPADRVRRAAASLALAIQSNYKHIESSAESTSKKKKLKVNAYWAMDTIYGPEVESEGVRWLETADAKKFIDLILVPGLQECTIDPSYVGRLLESGLSSTSKTNEEIDRKDKRLRSSTKTAILSFLSSHAIAAPSLLYKLRLLRLLNNVKKAPTSRTIFLLPVLQSWIATDHDVHAKKCSAEKVSLVSLEEQIVGVIADGGNIEELQPLLDILGRSIGGESLVSTAAKRIAAVWLTLDPITMTSVAESLLEMVLDRRSEPGRSEAMEVLRNVPIPTEPFRTSFEKARAHIKASLSKGGSTNAKRRRTSTGVDVTSEKEDSVAIAVRRTTTIAELLELQGAQNHTSLLQQMFTVLGEIDSAEVAGTTYLQSVLLACMREIVNSYKASSTDPQKEHTIRADVLVSCIRSTTSPQVQNSALLLLASLADVAPDVVKHSVMPIFTFMGANTLRQDDEYSAHVIEQTVQRIIPPLVKSLQEQDGSPIEGAADLVTTFVSSYRHVPTHRRLRLFTSLTETLGADDFLFALLVKLAAHYNDNDEESIAEFVADLAGSFPAQIQVHSVVQYLDVTNEVLDSRENGIAQLLIGSEQDIKDLPALVLAKRLLSVLTTVLSGERLKARISRTLKTGQEVDKKALLDRFSRVIERILGLGEKYMHNEEIRPDISTLLERLLELLSTSKFVAVVETLINRPESQFRRSALATFKLRILSESRSDGASRNAILELAPKISAIISSDAEVELKAGALLCLDAITNKFGKQKPEIITSFFDAVTGTGGLRSMDDGLRVHALVCLTSMTTTVGGRIVPVLPKTVPVSLELVKEAVESEKDLLHNAALVYLDELCKTVPSFMNSYLPKILPLAAASASCVEFDDTEAMEIRTDFLNTIASKLEAKAVIAALVASWKEALDNGTDAVREQVDTARKVILHAKKTTVQKISQQLLILFSLAFDVRNAWRAKGEEEEKEDEEELKEIEELAIKTAISMVFKLNDSIFKPMFVRMVEWATEDGNEASRLRRTDMLWRFQATLTEELKSLVTDYYSYILEPAVSQLSSTFSPSDQDHLKNWSSLLTALRIGFATDDRDFWQLPTHYSEISTSLLSQLDRASTLSPSLVTGHVIPAITELAAASQSEEHFKAINTGVCKKMRDERAEVRLVAMRTMKELYAKLGEEWLGLLPETVPFIAEGVEDDDEDVERETRALIRKVEEFLGEGELQGMLT